MSARRGRIEGIEHVGESQLIKAKVPLEELLGYTGQLRSRFDDRVSCRMEFARYKPRPNGPPGDGDAADSDFDWT